MDNSEQAIHCRICGSFKLNKFYYALDLGHKVGIDQILRRDGAIDSLIRPCECRGEFAHAHKICLENWIETTRHERCDVCSYKYNVTYNDRSIFDWIYETHQVSRSLKLLSMAILVYYLGALGILVNSLKKKESILNVIVLTSSYVWMSICSMYLVVYIYHRTSDFKSWHLANRRVTVEANKEPQLDIEPRPKDVLKSSGFKPKVNETTTIH